jgi:hypothetical protein
MIPLEDKLCIMTVDTLQELFAENADSVSLYMFYYKQCKIQKTNQSWTTDSFIMKWLWWWRQKLVKAKRVLESKNLMEKVVKKWDNGKIEWHYIKLNYIRSEGDFVHTYQKPHVDWTTSGKWTTNAWSYINRNAWSNKKEILPKQKKKVVVCISKEEANQYLKELYEPIKDTYKPEHKDQREMIKYMVMCWYKLKENETLWDLGDWLKEILIDGKWHTAQGDIPRRSWVMGIKQYYERKVWDEKVKNIKSSLRQAFVTRWWAFNK